MVTFDSLELACLEWRFFIVHRKGQTAVMELNDDFRSSQKIAGLPATISGKLDKARDGIGCGAFRAAFLGCDFRE